MSCFFLALQQKNSLIFEKKHLPEAVILMLDKTTPIGKAQLLVNAGIERLLVIRAVVIIPVPTRYSK